MRNALTVDVEDYFHVAAFARQIDPATWDRFPLRVERNTHRLLELFSDVAGFPVCAGWGGAGSVAHDEDRYRGVISRGGPSDFSDDDAARATVVKVINVVGARPNFM